MERKKPLRLQYRLRRRSGLRVEELECRNLPSVMTPGQIRHAYGFDQTSFKANDSSIAADGAGQTIAIVSAYDAPNIVSDLKTFNKAFKLSDAEITKASPSGKTPSADKGWALETSLDVQWSHAIAPGAKILLVEAASDSMADLMSAVDYARNQSDVSVVSMSWGIPEAYLTRSAVAQFDQVFTTPAGHQGITFVAASGDNGAWQGPMWPAISTNVLAVGGTTLQASASGAYAGESAWSGSGGGISSLESEPTYQQGVQRTGRRTAPDVGYDANPNTGYYVYDSLGTGSGTGGWYGVGGTSAGAPQWAALIAVANQGRVLNGLTTLASAQAALYQLPRGDFHDSASGSNGYRATSGYDLATGLGSPKANLVIADLVRYGVAAQIASSSSASSTTTNSGLVATSTNGGSSAGSSNLGNPSKPVTRVVVITISSPDLTALATAALPTAQASLPSTSASQAASAIQQVTQSDSSTSSARTPLDLFTPRVESGGGGLEQDLLDSTDDQPDLPIPSQADPTPSQNLPVPGAQPSMAPSGSDGTEEISDGASDLYFAATGRGEIADPPVNLASDETGDETSMAGAVALLGGLFVSLGEVRRRSSKRLSLHAEMNDAVPFLS